MDEPQEEIHIPLTLYGLDGPGKEAKEKFMSFMTRPQDWGDPRWRYEQVRFQHVTARNGYNSYVFVYHLWTDLPVTGVNLIKYFQGAIIMQTRPGMAPELCGMTHLSPDDFWQKSWGKAPPVFEQAYEDFEA